MACLCARVAALAERFRALRRAKRAVACMCTSLLESSEETRSRSLSTTISEEGGMTTDASIGTWKENKMKKESKDVVFDIWVSKLQAVRLVTISISVNCYCTKMK